MRDQSTMPFRRRCARWVFAFVLIATPLVAGTAIAQGPQADDQEYIVITPKGYNCHPDCGEYQVCC